MNAKRHPPVLERVNGEMLDWIREEMYLKKLQFWTPYFLYGRFDDIICCLTPGCGVMLPWSGIAIQLCWFKKPEGFALITLKLNIWSERGGPFHDQIWSASRRPSR
jgi:hypothetical protein